MSNIQTKIRLERAARKFTKIIYSKNIQEKRVEKLLERNDILSKSINKTWEIMYLNGFKPMLDNDNPIFFKDFDCLSLWQKEMEKNNKRISKICTEIGKTEEEILSTKYERNVGRGSQSF